MSTICIEWKTDIMPARAHFYFHAECWSASSHSYSNMHIREVTEEVHAACMECGKPLMDVSRPMEENEQ